MVGIGAVRTAMVHGFLRAEKEAKLLPFKSNQELSDLLENKEKEFGRIKKMRRIDALSFFGTLAIGTGIYFLSRYCGQDNDTSLLSSYSVFPILMGLSAYRRSKVPEIVFINEFYKSVENEYNLRMKKGLIQKVSE